MFFPDQPYVRRNILYAGSGQGVFRSIDGGQTWQAANSGLTNLEVRTIVVDRYGGAVYAGTAGGVFRTVDGGQTWQPLTNEGLPNPGIQVLLLGSFDTLYAGLSAGLFSTLTSAEIGWQPYGINPPSTSVTSLALDFVFGGMFAGTAGGEVLFTGFDTPSWRPLDDFPSDRPVTALLPDLLRGPLYAGTAGEGVFRFFRSSEIGGWQSINLGLSATPIVRALALDNRTGTLYLAADEGLFFSIDQGDNWQSVGAGLPSGAIVSLIVQPEDGTLYAGTGAGSIFQSGDGGQSWQALASLPATTPVQALALDQEPSRMAVSQAALEELQLIHPDEADGQRYPWRAIPSTLTGLPVFLRLWLDRPLEIAPDQEISPPLSSLLNPRQMRAIFGLRDEFQAVLDRELAPAPLTRLNGPTNEQGQPVDLPICHLRWYQLYPHQDRLYPIVGGSLRLHGIIGDRRAAVSSSYFPLPADYFDDADQRPAQPPLDLALQAVMKAAQTMQQPHLPFLVALLEQALAARNREELRRLFPLLEPEVTGWRRWPIIGVKWLLRQPGLSTLGMLLAPLALWLAGLSRQAARLSLVPVRDDAEKGSTFEGILPFGYLYHWVKQVQVAAAGQDPWFIDVETRSGQPLGDPWQAVLPAPAQYFQTSAEAQAGTPTGSVSAFRGRPSLAGQPTLQTLEAELAGYIMGLNDLLNDPNDSAKVTTGIQALRLYAYLRRTCGVLSNSIPGGVAPIRIQFIQPDNGLMGFNYATIQRPELRFWQDRDGGISLPGVPKIYAPAQDPEVALHEFTHALFWQLNGDPWDTQMALKLNPFGRALHEGYAMYLPRSLVASDSSVTPNDEAEFAQPWGRSAYREWDNSPPDWVQSWVFPRRAANQATPKPGDYLPAPNTYPAGRFSIEDIKGYYLSYQVGMVWGRALSDLRTLLGHRRTDWLAMQSYFYLHGHIANFELAAEGLLDADQKLNNEIQLNNGSQPIWAGRGVAAGQGVYGFAQITQATGGSLINAATSNSLWRSPDQGLTWYLDQTPSAPDGRTLTGLSAVVKVATAAGDISYAATTLPPANSSPGTWTPWRPNILSRRTGDTIWSAVGNWSHETGNAIPSKLLLINDQLFAATNRGVYFFKDGKWQRVGQTNHEFVAIDVAPVTLVPGTSPTRSVRLAACLANQIRQIRLDSLERGSWGLLGNLFNNSASIRLTAMIAWDHPNGGSTNGTYIGTLADGLWQIPVASNFSTLRVSSNSIGAILALATSPDNRKLYVATDKNIFTLTAGQNLNNSWPALSLPTSGAKVTSLFLTENGRFLFAGTLAHGIWRLDLSQPNPNWEPCRTPLDTSALPSTLTLKPEEQALLSFTHRATLPASYQITNRCQDIQVKIAQPVLPLTIINPNSNNYTLTPGPVVLALKNTGQNSTSVRVALTNGPINNIEIC